MKLGKDTIIINQFAGLGDIIFIQTILNDLIEQGKKVILPVAPQYENIQKHFPLLKVISKERLHINYESRIEEEQDGGLVIPLRFSDTICKVPYSDCMKSKYIYFNKDWHTWKDKCFIVRDDEAEDRLYYDVLGLKDNEPYNLINENYMTNNSGKIKITKENGLRNVYVQTIPPYTHIDWLKVYQNATNIYAVSSSNIYLFELFPLKAKEVHLYIRKPHEKTHENYMYLLTKNYIFHE